MLSLMRYVSHELGVTLIMVTHDLAIAEQSQRIIRIEDGRIVADSAAAPGGDSYDPAQ